jgi:hypothetical protein
MNEDRPQLPVQTGIPVHLFRSSNVNTIDLSHKNDSYGIKIIIKQRF